MNTPMFYFGFILLVFKIETVSSTDHDVVLLTNGTEWKFNLTEFEHRDIVINVDPFDFLYDEELILFLDGRKSYQKIQYLTSATESKEIAEGLFRTYSIEYDWLNRNIYWLQINIIEVSGFNGTYRRVLYWRNMEDVNYMNIDPTVGLMFWSNGGANPNIVKASMDGDESSRSELVRDGMGNPFGLTKDSQQQLLYWTDSSLLLIERCGYNGENRASLLKLEQQIPGHLRFYNDVLYWIDDLGKNINAFSLTMNKTSIVTSLPLRASSDIVPYRDQQNISYHLRIYDKAVHKEVSVYDIKQMECQQLKLLSSSPPYVVCRCSAYFNSTDDGRCIEVEDELPTVYVALPTGFLAVSGGNMTKISDVSIRRFVFLNEHELIGAIGDLLHRTSINNITEYLEPIKMSFVAIPWDMSYDWIGKNYYWILNTFYSSFLRVINLHHENNEMELTLFARLQSPFYGVRIDIEKRLLFLLLGKTFIRMAMDCSTETQHEFALNIQSYGDGSKLSADVMDEALYVGVIYSSKEYSTTYKYTYDGKLLATFNLLSFTSGIKYRGKYELIFDGVSLKLCDKRYHGNCKTVISQKDGKAQVVSYNLPISTSPTGHPCEINNGDCSEICLLTYREPFYTCQCKQLYRLLPDNKTCVLEPCKLNNGNCTMKCVDLGGVNHRCECLHGFEMAPDGRTCNGEIGFALINKLRSGWRQIDLSSGNYAILNTYVGMYVEFMDYDPIERQLYFNTQTEEETDTKSHVVNSNLDGSALKIIASDKFLIVDLCFNWITRDIYWTTLLEIFHRNLEMTQTDNILFKDVVVAIDKDIEDKIKAVRIRIQLIQEDVFNGLLCVVWSTSTDVEYSGGDKYWFNVTCAENGIFQGQTADVSVVHVVDYLGYFTSALTIDSLNNQFYIVTANEIYKTDLYVCFSDGHGGLRHVYSQANLQTGAIFGDGFMYYLELGQFFAAAKMNLDTHERNILTPLTTSGASLIFVGANLQTKDTGSDGRNCSEYSKCWSMYNAWICLNPDQICDGISDCYQAHDEHYCSLCTSNCSLALLSMSCTKKSPFNNNMIPYGLNEFLNWTSHPLSDIISLENTIKYDCSIQIQLDSIAERHLRYIKINSLYHWHKIRQVVLSTSLRDLSGVLDASLFGSPMLLDIDPKGIGIFKNARNLKLEELAISKLPEKTFFENSELMSLTLLNNVKLTQIDGNCFLGLTKLETLTITGSNLPQVDGNSFNDLGNLTFLNLSSNNIQIFGAGIFQHLVLLKILDISRNDIKLTSELFSQTNMLGMIYCDSFTICCIKPLSVAEENCTAPKDDISSCSNLIENRVLAVFLWLFGIMALCGNLAAVIYRGFIDKSIFTKTYFIFVYNLSISDLVMSVYLITIAVHDVSYDGIYVWNEYTWKRSFLCRFAGVLSMISSESSMMFVSLITLERFMGLHFAFGTMKISRRNAVFISFLVWILATIIGLVPSFLYPEFFSRSGVCIGIPLTKYNTAGFEYSIFVFLGLNFLLCAVIPFGQYYIMDEVKKSSKRVGATNTARNIAVAKRLSIVVITDCLCWLPIGILIVLSLSGIKTPREVYAWVIIFVLPVNAAVNPYLYTLTDIKREKIRKFFSFKKKNTTGMSRSSTKKKSRN